MKPIILAGPVKDITVGRYLAARDVDLLLYPVNLHHNVVPMLKEWIEGPKFIVELEEGHEDIHSLSVNGYLSKHYLGDEDGQVVIADMRKGIIDLKLLEIADYFLVNSPSQIRELQLLPEKCLIDYQDQKSVYAQAAGYFIQTGSETMVGIADFEALDDFFDWIEQLD